MIAMHCRDRHGRQVDDCADCQELRAYAALRLSRCVFKEGKPTCQKCPVHCYRPDMRAKITAVMRHAGPRMLLEHPYWALRHLLDGWSPTPEAPRRRETSRLDGG
ncbi:hypothetical protein AW736_00640 [Termitidicoccus mucosus]|uniref:Nitrous oxide-stimulated promoter n=2 Tax=Termitidicoccus mucosus TaxID=1184151 RepID=A0A178IKF0_9BACT|nr:hypothetical protein AW736_00640 [Opitutaceae bacterium TSB47]